MLWLLQEAAPDVFDPLYSNFPIQNSIEISKNMTSNLRFCTGFPIQMWSCNFCQCIGSASWRSHNIFVFKYFFDRSFLKFRKIDEDCFHHRENATNAMRKSFFRKKRVGPTYGKFYIYINHQLPYTRSVSLPTCQRAFLDRCRPEHLLSLALPGALVAPPWIPLNILWRLR